MCSLAAHQSASADLSSAPLSSDELRSAALSCAKTRAAHALPYEREKRTGCAFCSCAALPAVSMSALPAAHGAPLAAGGLTMTTQTQTTHTHTQTLDAALTSAHKLIGAFVPPQRRTSGAGRRSSRRALSMLADLETQIGELRSVARCADLVVAAVELCARIGELAKLDELSFRSWNQTLVHLPGRICLAARRAAQQLDDERRAAELLAQLDEQIAELAQPVAAQPVAAEPVAQPVNVQAERAALRRAHKRASDALDELDASSELDDETKGLVETVKRAVERGERAAQLLDDAGELSGALDDLTAELGELAARADERADELCAEAVEQLDERSDEIDALAERARCAGQLSGDELADELCDLSRSHSEQLAGAARRAELAQLVEQLAGDELTQRARCALRLCNAALDKLGDELRERISERLDALSCSLSAGTVEPLDAACAADELATYQRSAPLSGQLVADVGALRADMRALRDAVSDDNSAPAPSASAELAAAQRRAELDGAPAPTVSTLAALALAEARAFHAGACSDASAALGALASSDDERRAAALVELLADASSGEAEAQLALASLRSLASASAERAPMLSAQRLAERVAAGEQLAVELASACELAQRAERASCEADSASAGAHYTLGALAADALDMLAELASSARAAQRFGAEALRELRDMLADAERAELAQRLDAERERLDAQRVERIGALCAAADDKRDSAQLLVEQLASCALSAPLDELGDELARCSARCEQLHSAARKYSADALALSEQLSAGAQLAAEPLRAEHSADACAAQREQLAALRQLVEQRGEQLAAALAPLRAAYAERAAAAPLLRRCFQLCVGGWQAEQLSADERCQLAEAAQLHAARARQLARTLDGAALADAPQLAALVSGAARQLDVELASVERVSADILIHVRETLREQLSASDALRAELCAARAERDAQRASDALARAEQLSASALDELDDLALDAQRAARSADSQAHSAALALEAGSWPTAARCAAVELARSCAADAQRCAVQLRELASSTRTAAKLAELDALDALDALSGELAQLLAAAQRLAEVSPRCAGKRQRIGEQLAAALAS
jgi:hypothetical protein